ncbi:YdhR family protein [candidate division KSB1 bacterium]
MSSRIRRTPIVSLIMTDIYCLLGRVRRSKEFYGREIMMEDGRKFKIFRQINLKTGKSKKDSSPAILIVRFKFARFSQKTNRRLSLIPIPMIVGFPGFRTKVWMADEDTGYWQGLYEFESEDTLEEYKKSFVLGIMNRRAVKDSISYRTIKHSRVSEYLNNRLVKGQ